ncbi:SRPBCC domain-containing protein [Mucilaginibacter sp.]|uniref:SRPBCC family protein n=1 Tax=Mucilaginibacter sp. TaxID=1882438 RepID=UPI00262DA30E|nr:SRPBCC domain-containing protein [Mucilaginibacter sp.]MDB5029570.1 hypothetical protein [Mucilaginibacter sp.]
MNAEPFVIEQTYNAPVNAVWSALTDKNKMKEWYFDVDDFKPEVGFTFYFTGEDKGVKFVHECVVKEVITGKKLAYSWRYLDFQGNSLVTFELFAEGGQTRLKLTHTGLESFPADNTSFAKESFARGWTYITGTSLKNYLEK